MLSVDLFHLRYYTETKRSNQNGSKSMRVIFIIPPFGLMKDNGKIKQKMGFLPYLGLASIATILKNEGHSIKILDLQVKNMPLDAIIMEIKKFNADIVGFSVTSPLITVVEEIAQRIKKN